MTKRVLIADDEWELRNLVKLLLEDYDLEIFEAEDGESVLNIAKEQKLDLMILDNNMPGFTGYELIQKLKVDPKLKDIPIMMLTGKKFDPEMQKMIERDVNSYLMKPFEEDKILNAIEKILGKLEKKGAAVPEMPGVPAVPEVPAEPAIIHSISPKIPSVPDVPAAPEVPSVSKIPSIPQVPATPEIEVPAPSVPPPTVESPPGVQVEPVSVDKKKGEEVKVEEKVSTKFYLVSGITLKRLVCSICNVEPILSGITSADKSILLISYGSETDQQNMNLVLDIFGTSLPVVSVDAKLFQDKLKEIRSLGGSVFELNPEAFKKV